MKLRSVMTILALGAASPSFAADPVNVYLDGFKYGGNEQATIRNGATTIGTYRAGEYKGTLNKGTVNEQSFSTFCTDVYQSLWFGTDYQYQRLTAPETQSLWGASTTYNSNSYGLVSKLFTTAYTSVNSSTTSAAFQYALWELLYEKSGTYTIGDNGNFSLTNTDGNASTKANEWLAAVTGASATEGYVIQSLFKGELNPSRVGVQDLVIATPVPEPQTYALALVSLGIVAGYARRKRDKA